MKKIFFATCLVSLLAVTATKAQQPPETEAALKKVICRKWQFQYVEMQGQKMDLPPDMKGYFQFYENNIFEETTEGKKERGNWKYFSAEKSIGCLREDGWLKLKIVSVTAKKLILNMEVEKGAISNIILLPVK